MQVCTSCRKLLKAKATQCPDDGAAAETVGTLPKGTLLGAYQIERELGEGGMGFVYEATHQVLNRRSAIKMLRPELASQANIVTRFLNEAKAVNLIDHQNIVNVYDYGDSQDGSVYFVMEFLEGETLDDLMHKRRPMPMPLLLHVFGQIAKALAAAHAKQIVHRDLKPANVYVISREDNPYFIKLLDFGIAQLRGAGAVQGLTIAGSVMGTPQYMSPEQVSGGIVDARSDVWAMGVMMYRAATGQAPFQGEEFAELADKILHHVPRPAGELAELPAPLSALIASCLERDAGRRCPSIAALIEGLARVTQACKLDDDAILAAVLADAGALGEGLPARGRNPTRDSLAGSLPRYQGIGDRRAPGSIAGSPPRRSRLALYLGVGAAIALLGGAAYALVSRDRTDIPRSDPRPGPNPELPVDGGTGPDAGTTSVLDAFRTGGLVAARALAQQHLREAITTGSLQHKGYAIDALGMVRVKAGTPLLDIALRIDDPAVRIKAGQALCAIGLPDSAAKVRAAFDGSGEGPKMELAAALYCLGDKDARAILVRALESPGQRLLAATTMADAGDDGGRAVLADTLDTFPPEREQWQRAAGAMMKLGDESARKRLVDELSQSAPARAIGAAERLARVGDTAARDLLVRAVADKDHPRRGDAAVALARLGDKRALDWVADGFQSTDPGERTLALAVCGLLPAGARPHLLAIATIATDDKDLSVRLTAEAALLGQ
jgi:HEAT repeat protein/tRNA A-37 threonylcarbamoyl transferase component Bud32